MKKNLLLAVLSGLLLSVAWPTYGYSAFIFVAFVPLLFVEKKLRASAKRTKRKVFFLSYLSFLIWNIFTTWWLWYSTKAGAVFAIAANTLLMSATFMIFHIVAKRTKPKIAYIFLICIWLSFEKFHLSWDVSWPWLHLGNVFSEQIAWIQWYEFTGAFGGSLWVLTVNVVLFLVLDHFLKYRNKRYLSQGIGTVVLLFALPIIISYVMYINHQEKGEKISAVVVQPNIDPYTEKYVFSNEQIIQLLIDLCQDKIDDNVHFLITPETVLADNIRLKDLPHSYPLTLLQSYVNKNPNLNVILGLAMIDFFSDASLKTSQSNYWRDGIWYNDYNSALLVNKQRNTELYHKSKLVVGVENFPYQGVLKPIFGETLIDLGGTVALKTTQPQRSVFKGNNTSGIAAPVICYESIYGEFVNGYIQNGANFLSILTNDAWWKNTQGHKQLLSYTRLRAVETRRAIARSANTGISAFINQRGDIIAYLPYQKQGSLKAEFQLNNELTLYVKWGDYIARIAYFLSFFIFLMAFTRKREKLF
ncbi:apolipoprotein N-acyltransferase [Capnocytophaga canimorsus]|uniref:apolipoprotein N-acyltransferase n=1 Tax=Capnocytophaga canimorsus TaxID=28188 RepID=UPI00385B0FCC